MNILAKSVWPKNKTLIFEQTHTISITIKKQIMKAFYLTILCVFITVLAQAQIPNPSFETWSNGSPTGWTANNGSGDSLVVISTNAHAGQYAADMKVNTIQDNTFGSVLQTTGVSQNGFFPVNSPPGALYGWYISNLLTGDIMAITSYAQAAVQEYAGTIIMDIPNSTTVYKQFAFNYEYPVGAAADSVSIAFQMVNSYASNLNGSSYFIIDDLSFGPVVTGEAQLSETPVLEECTPNPTSSNVNVIYSLNATGTVSMALYDLMGRRVMNLLDNTEQTQGRYKIPTDVSALPGGVYCCTLTVNGQTFTQKLLVTK